MKQSLFTVTALDTEGNRLYYNTLTQAFARLSNEDPSEEDSTFLYRQGLFVDDDAQETALPAACYEKDRTNGSAFCLMIATTLNCNLACPYCYEREVKHRGVMTPAVQADVVAFIQKRMTELGSKIVKIGWYGGEPLMGIDAIEGITSLLRDKGISFEATMISNCALVDEKMADRIAACGIQKVTATLDGVGERHDIHRPSLSGKPTFDAIVAGVRNLDARGISVHVLFNQDRNNAYDRANVEALFADTPRIQVVASQLFDYCQCLDCVDDFKREQYDLYERPEEFASEQYEQFLSFGPNDAAFASFMSPIRLFCGRNVDSYVVIDERGNLYECDGDVGYADRVIGTITDEQAPQHAPYSPFTDKLCKECAFLPICLGNCRWTRDYTGESCIPQKAIIDRILTDWSNVLTPLPESTERVTLLRKGVEPGWESDTPYELWS